MKILLFGLAFLLQSAANYTASAQEGAADPASGSSPVENPEKQLQIQVEWVEVEAETATELLMDENPSQPDEYRSSNAGPLRQTLQESIDRGKAALVESVMVTARSGNRAKAESIQEYIYPTEYDAGSFLHSEKALGTATKQIAPQARAFETRNLGVTLEVDPVIGTDGRTIDLNLAPELVYLTGKESWGKHEADGSLVEILMPSIYCVKTTTQVALIAGEYLLLSVQSPRNLETGMTDPEKKILVFVKANLTVVGMPLKQ
jgi:hypothetical protein